MVLGSPNPSQASDARCYYTKDGPGTGPSKWPIPHGPYDRAVVQILITRKPMSIFPMALLSLISTEAQMKVNPAETFCATLWVSQIAPQRKFLYLHIKPICRTLTPPEQYLAADLKRFMDAK